VRRPLAQADDWRDTCSASGVHRDANITDLAGNAAGRRHAPSARWRRRDTPLLPNKDPP
jgi:hypothetical protein